MPGVKIIVNPQRACAVRVTVVVSCVCLSVCLSAHAILAVRTIKSIMKDNYRAKYQIFGRLKRRFSLNCLIRKLEHFTYLGRGGHSLVDAYSMCNVSYTLRYMFAYV